MLDITEDSNCFLYLYGKAGKLTLTFHGRAYTFKRIKFPMAPSYAITSHLAKGITKEMVIIDYGCNQAKRPLFSVPFSRAN